MEKNIRIISGVFFIVALNICFLIVAHPVQARSDQIRPNVTWLDSNYPFIDNIFASKNLPVIPFSANPDPALVSATQIPGELKTEVLSNPGSGNPMDIDSSSRVNNQQFLFILLLMASAKN